MNFNPLSWLRNRISDSFRAELRSTLADPDPWLQTWFNGGGQSRAGVIVNEQTALALSAVYQAVRVLSEAVAVLPFQVYRRLDPRGKERVPAHPAYRLLSQKPNQQMTPFTFRETLMGHVLIWGNGYAEIERTGGGVPIALHILRPDRVCPEWNQTTDAIQYRVFQPGRPTVILQPPDVFHLRGLGFDGLMGYSPVRLARQAIGLGIAAETFGASFFGNGTKMGGKLSYPGKLSDIAKKNLRESIASTHGGPDNAHKFMILEEGMKWESDSVPPDDAQFLQTREFQVDDVARWFNLPPSKLGSTKKTSYASLEQSSLDFVVHSLMPWLVRFEEETQSKLIATDDQDALYAEHLVDGQLRGDIASRYSAYAKGIQFGWLSVNDVREKENMNPLPNGQGDLYLVPVNMQPAAVAQAQADAAEAGEVPPAPGMPQAVVLPKTKTQTPEGSEAVPDDTSDVADAARSAISAAHRPLLIEAMGRVMRRESEVLRRAAKRPDLVAFVDKFYGEHEYIRSHLEPIVTAYNASLDAVSPGTNGRASGAEIPADYANEARSQILEAIAKADPAELIAEIEAFIERRETDVPAAIADSILECRGDEDQPRDDHGRFGSGGSGVKKRAAIPVNPPKRS